MSDNLLGMPETRLPADPAADRLAGLGDRPGQRDLEGVAAAHPASSLAWAMLAERALADDEAVTAYAFARVGYHRGLDALRRAGWKGRGPIPWSHVPNRGFLRALASLARAARVIGETDELQRCQAFLRDSSAEAADTLGL
ncbi:MAG: DUF3151 domain-containing protein [Dermatophilaceae bacterium]